MSLYPRISLVTPSLNQAQYLEQTISSVLTQSYPNLEYIVLDGGSTDGSLDILKKYDHQLAFWESGPDSGQADAIRRGFAMSSGEILGWLNSDDILLPGALCTVSDWFVRNPSQPWAVGGTLMLNAEGGMRVDALGNPVIMPDSRVTASRLLYWDCGFCQPAVFWRRSLYDQVGGLNPHFKFCMDYDLFVRFARITPSGRVRRLLAGFRLHPASKTSSWDDVRVQENREVRQRHGRSSPPGVIGKARFRWHALCFYFRIRTLQFGLMSRMHPFARQIADLRPN
jgi:glycosyltransferase involved in cell wall biosynthesis